MIVDPLSAERIGLDWLRAALAPVGAFGRRCDEERSPYGPGEEAAAADELRAVLAAAETLERDGVGRLRVALRAIPEPTPIVTRARVGDPLGDVDFYELGRFVDGLDALARAWEAAGGDPSVQPPQLAALRALLAPGRSQGGFYLDDAFASGLAAARTAYAAAQAAVDAQRETLAALVRATTGVDPTGEEFVVLHDVYAGPLPEGVHVVRETATYRLASLAAPAPQRDAALTVLADAEEVARRTLAEQIALQADALAAATRALGALDRLLARVAFVQRWGGCLPAFSAGPLAFDEATFAPLADALATRGRRYTPLALRLDGVAVLTGPNMGGKSAALATTGFLTACVALGVPPPARRARLRLVERIVWVGGDGPAERTRLLSSYAAEVVRARDVLAGASPVALVLVDEFARTTGPREGKALLVAFVEALRARGARALIATHFDGIAEAAGVEHLRIAGVDAAALEDVDARDLDAALDAINAAMDYRVVPAGAARSDSDALALATLLGLDADLVTRARSLYDAG
jgi:hypothetical protein